MRNMPPRVTEVYHPGKAFETQKPKKTRQPTKKPDQIRPKKTNKGHKEYNIYEPKKSDNYSEDQSTCPSSPRESVQQDLSPIVIIKPLPKLKKFEP